MFMALQAVVERRRSTQQETWACFVDFTKAYDRVPHAALLAKLWDIGVRGRLYRFIRELYRTSEVCVEVGLARSAAFPLKRGLRQGCPMSPVLFNVYASDLLPPMERWGVRVPEAGWRLPDLMYADDLVLLASTKHDLEEMLRLLAKWCHTWHMQVNEAKCGVMLCPKKPRGSTPPPDIRMPVWDGTSFYRWRTHPQGDRGHPLQVPGDPGGP